MTGEPAVDTRGRLLGTLFLLSGHAVLRSPGAGRSGPQGIGFPHSSVHVRMNVGGVRIKSIIKVDNQGCTIRCVYLTICISLAIIMRKTRDRFMCI